MKRLIAAAALVSSLVAVQAQAATYQFSFTDAGLGSGDTYSFSLDTSTATYLARTGVSSFAGVAIFDNGVASTTETVTVPDAAVTTTGDRYLSSSNGSIKFTIDPLSATGTGSSLSFTTGAFAGSDLAHGGAAVAFNVSQAAVSAAPEPGAWALMLGGVGITGAMMRAAFARRRENELKSLASA